MASTTACAPNSWLSSVISSGRRTTAVFTEILSAPDSRMRRASATDRMPPPTASGINTLRFFDDFQTGVTDAADTANQVKRWLNDPNTTCLLGNHDMSYGWCRQNRRLICPDYDAAKWIAINATVTTRDWQNFKLHAWLESDKGPWLVSHAGIHPVWLAGAEPGRHREFIDRACADAWTCLNRGEHHFLLGRGVSRSGDQRIGGICWMDWDELVPC